MTASDVTLSRLSRARTLRVAGKSPVVVALFGSKGNLSLRAGERLDRNSSGQTLYNGRVVNITNEIVSALVLKARLVVED